MSDQPDIVPAQAQAGIGIDVALEVYRERLAQKEDEIVALHMTLKAREQEIVRLQNALSSAHAHPSVGDLPAPAEPDVPSAP